jgi:2-dehydropantoate 2-reductase
MRYVAIGVGAVGGTIAGLLADAGREVVAVARGEHLDAIRANGLEVRRASGSVHADLPAYGSVAEAGIRAGDVVMLGVKSQDTSGVLEQVAAAVPDPAEQSELTILCAQNGVENERRALRLFHNVQSMCVFLPSIYVEPGVVATFAHPRAGLLDVGRYPTGVDDTTRTIVADLEAADFAASALDEVLVSKYSKLLTNLANAADALVGRPALATDAGKELMAAVRAEARQVYDAAGIRALDVQEDVARRKGIAEPQQLETAVRPGASSWQSLARGARTLEVDYLTGEVVLLGRLHGVPTPVNAALQVLANNAAREGRPPAAMELEQLLARLP